MPQDGAGDFIHPEIFLATLFLIALTGAMAYCLGSVSPAFYAARARGTDLRAQGERNLDFTNAWDILGKRVGALVFLADFLKAQLALGLAWYMSGSPWFAALACVAVVAGEVWPAFHGFRGGRGTASTAGALLGISPFTLLICATVALLVSSLTGRRDHAELIAVLLLPAVAIFVGKGDIPLMGLTIILTGLLLWTRRELVGELIGAEKEEN